MKKWIAVLAVLVATTASADLDAICQEMLIRDAVRHLIADERIDGTRPVSTQEDMCGGGYDPEGNRIKPWPCLVQVWAGVNGSHLIVLYGKRPRGWVLSDWRICDGDNSNCTRPSIPPCETIPAKAHPGQI